MMSPVTIRLNFRAEDFEPIYFRDGYHLVFKNPTTKNHALMVIAMGIIWLGVGVKLLLYGGPKTIFVVLSIFFAITALRLKRRTDGISRWKREIALFLEKLRLPTERSLLLTAESFSYRESDELTTENWTEVNAAEIADDYISMKASAEYLFPKSSMSPAEFELLSRFISTYVP